MLSINLSYVVILCNLVLNNITLHWSGKNKLFQGLFTIALPFWGVFLDAFDLVDHCKLFQKLKARDLPSVFYRLGVIHRN